MIHWFFIGFLLLVVAINYINMNIYIIRSTRDLKRKDEKLSKEYEMLIKEIVELRKRLQDGYNN